MEKNKFNKFYKYLLIDYGDLDFNLPADMFMMYFKTYESCSLWISEHIFCLDYYKIYKISDNGGLEII